MNKLVVTQQELETSAPVVKQSMMSSEAAPNNYRAPVQTRSSGLTSSQTQAKKKKAADYYFTKGRASQDNGS